MTKDEETLILIKGVVFDLHPADQEKVRMVVETIRQLVHAHGTIGLLAFALVGAEVAVSE